MTRILQLAFAMLLFGAWAREPAVGPALAADAAPAIAIDRAWARSTPPGLPNGAAYMTIRNAGATSDRLVSASSPLSNLIEIHRTTRDGDIVRMSPVPGGLAVPANGTVVLEPGGYHLMLVSLKGPLKEGGTLPLDLTFAVAGKIHVDAAIEGMGAAAPPMSHMRKDGM